MTDPNRQPRLSDDREYIRTLVREAVSDAMKESNAQFKAHIDDKLKELEELYMSGFPNKDPKSHEQYHTKQIEYMNDRIALWKDIRSKSIIGFVWLMAGLLGTAILEYVKKRLMAP